VVILIVISVLAYAVFAPSSSPPIQVANMNVWAPDNVCGLSANPIGYQGYSGSTNTSTAFELEVPNFNSTSCTITSVTTNTSGFALSDIQEPLTVPGSGNTTMNLTISSPDVAFSGNLSLVFS
jgi:hypothetical protein